VEVAQNEICAEGFISNSSNVSPNRLFVCGVFDEKREKFVGGPVEVSIGNQ